MADGAGWIKTRHEGGRFLVAVGGRWTTAELADLDPALKALKPAGTGVVLDLGAIERLDTAGAWVLHRARKSMSQAGREARFENVRPEHAGLLAEAEHADHPQRRPLKGRDPHPFVHLVERIGKAVYDFGRAAAGLLGFFGLIWVMLARTALHPRRLRFTALVSHMERTGFDAIPIVGLLSFLIGVVIAFQGADQLRRFGAEVFVVNLLGISVLREMAILLTAIVVAGRSGSSFTAEIGTMKVNEEVDALVTIGLDPIEVLVLPRMLALVIALPILAFLGAIAALYGGGLVAWLYGGIDPEAFLLRLRDAISIDHFTVGIIKAPVMAAVIGIVACVEGLAVEGSAESLGQHTTASVVKGIFFVIVMDGVFAIFFASIGM